MSLNSPVKPENKIRGLRITLKMGDVISINGQEVLIQALGAGSGQVMLAILCDREKYKVNRDFHPKREHLSGVLEKDGNR